MFKEKLTPILYNPIQNIEEAVTFPKLFYEASIAVTLKPEKNSAKKKKKKKLQTSIPREHRFKTLSKMLSGRIH